jgi:hypothetical protein
MDITGKRFGRLVAIAPTGKVTGGSAEWRFRCDCGQECLSTVIGVRATNRRSCGCLKKEVNAEQAKALQKRKTYVDGTCVEDIKEMTIPRNNTSGVRGVSWHSVKHRWYARIMFKGKNYHLGTFVELEDAAAARREAEEKYFGCFLERHQAETPEGCDQKSALPLALAMG